LVNVFPRHVKLLSSCKIIEYTFNSALKFAFLYTLMFFRKLSRLILGNLKKKQNN
jgi:hypothetical protein